MNSEASKAQATQAVSDFAARIESDSLHAIVLVGLGKDGLTRSIVVDGSLLEIMGALECVKAELMAAATRPPIPTEG